MTPPAARTRDPGDTGSATLWFSIFAFVLFLIVGLVYDGGLRIAATREATNVAEEAARAGSQALDVDAVYRAPEDRVLDPTAAVARAQAFLASRGWTGTVDASPTHVTVTVTRTQNLVFTQLWRRNTTAVTGRASARPLRGYAN